MQEQHKVWIAFAEDDLKAAKVLFVSQEVSVSSVLFHSQQCAEKALKAYLVRHSIPFKKTHDLTYLAKACAVLDKTFLDVIDLAVALTPFATDSRYPDNYLCTPSTVTAQISMDQADKLLEFVKCRLDE